MPASNRLFVSTSAMHKVLPSRHSCVGQLSNRWVVVVVAAAIAGIVYAANAADLGPAAPHQQACAQSIAVGLLGLALVGIARLKTRFDRAAELR